MSTVDEVVALIQAGRDERALAGMARYGINVESASGMSMPKLRGLAKRIVAEMGRKDPARHDMASRLWATGLHEARLLAGLIDLPVLVTAAQMDAWAADLDSWDVCDQLCINLFSHTTLAWDKAIEWSIQQEEFVKRAGFVLMAVLAVHDKKADDSAFIPFLAAVEREAGDERNLVKKAVNWALRSVGKHDEHLRDEAVTVARRLAASADRTTRWVANNALKELEGRAEEKVRQAR